MKRTRGRRRRWLWAGAAAGLVAATGVTLRFGPDTVRGMETFRVRQVEVHGTRFLEPYAVVQAAGITTGSSVFDPARAWRSGVVSLPLVEDARVRRSLPGGLIIEVREARPVALIAGDALRPVAADGRVLDIELAGAILDLPIVVETGAPEGGEIGDAVRSAVRMLTALAAGQGELADRLSQIEVTDRWLRLVFRDDGPEALLPLDPTTTQLRQLRLAFADLAARGELAAVRRIDVRFRDQVVVSFQRRPVS